MQCQTTSQIQIFRQALHVGAAKADAVSLCASHQEFGVNLSHSFLYRQSIVLVEPLQKGALKTRVDCIGSISVRGKLVQAASFFNLL